MKQQCYTPEWSHWYIENLENDIANLTQGITELARDIENGPCEKKLIIDKLTELASMKWKTHWKHLGE